MGRNNFTLSKGYDLLGFHFNLETVLRDKWRRSNAVLSFHDRKFLKYTLVTDYE